MLWIGWDLFKDLSSVVKDCAGGWSRAFGLSLCKPNHHRRIRSLSFPSSFRTWILIIDKPALVEADVHLSLDSTNTQKREMQILALQTRGISPAHPSTSIHCFIEHVDHATVLIIVEGVSMQIEGSPHLIA